MKLKIHRVQSSVSADVALAPGHRCYLIPRPEIESLETLDDFHQLGLRDLRNGIFKSGDLGDLGAVDAERIVIEQLLIQVGSKWRRPDA